MPFNKSTSAQGVPNKAVSDGKSKAAPMVNQPVKPTEKKPATIAPAYKK